MCEGCPRDERSPDGMINHNCKLCRELRYHEEHEVDDANPKDSIGVKKAPLRFVPPALAIGVAPAMALGAGKYGPYNWREKAVRLSVYLEAIDRHLAAFKDGQTYDEESGASHLSHVGACLAIIMDADAIGKLIDDRPTPGGAAALLKEQDASRARLHGMHRNVQRTYHQPVRP